MSRDDELDNAVDDLIERYLLFLRGRGPEPDLSVLPSDRRAEVAEQLEIVTALVDRDTSSPSIEEDPVAMRLGLLDSARQDEPPPNLQELPPVDDGPDDTPVVIALQDLAFRFNRLVTVEFAPAWVSRPPNTMRPVAQCTAPGGIVAVFIAAVDEWSQEPETVARFFRLHPEVSAIALVSEDAERAVVVTPADAHRSVDTVHGWLAPHSPSLPEPLSIALGRHFDQCLPAWERVADLDDLLGLGDLNSAVSEISAKQVAEARRSRPKLMYKKKSLQALSGLDPLAIAEVVIDVQSGHLEGDGLVERLARLAEAVAS
ncbi:hypothetical protein [Streptomyces sp. MBT53]|uniref:hypothetical protein n=1 Tax=Streptomyces sp. MBT53 TaxID=1488384 RepID=UPI0019143B9B|nr:hypothetical protein [Streptomyces sp. MBT53]MBK6018362.1 hypothetical protein [Streptomyces sp. MBT53]